MVGEGFDHCWIGVGSVTKNGFFDSSSQCTCRAKWKNFYKDKQLCSVIARSHEEYKVIDTFFLSFVDQYSDFWCLDSLPLSGRSPVRAVPLECSHEK